MPGPHIGRRVAMGGWGLRADGELGAVAPPRPRRSSCAQVDGIHALGELVARGRRSEIPRADVFVLAELGAKSGGDVGVSSEERGGGRLSGAAGIRMNEVSPLELDGHDVAAWRWKRSASMHALLGIRPALPVRQPGGRRFAGERPPVPKVCASSVDTLPPCLVRRHVRCVPNERNPSERASRLFQMRAPNAIYNQHLAQIDQC